MAHTIEQWMEETIDDCVDFVIRNRDSREDVIRAGLSDILAAHAPRPEANAEHVREADALLDDLNRRNAAYIRQSKHVRELVGAAREDVRTCNFCGGTGNVSDTLIPAPVSNLDAKPCPRCTPIRRALAHFEEGRDAKD